MTPATCPARDDALAKAAVGTLIGELSFESIDVGPPPIALSLERLAFTWITLAIQQRRGVDFAYALVPKKSK